MMWSFLKGVGVVLLIAVVVFTMMTIPSSHQNQIKSWCAEHDYEVLYCRRPWFSRGPFKGISNNENIYKTTVRNKRSNARKVIWFSFDAFGLDYKEQ